MVFLRLRLKAPDVFNGKLNRMTGKYRREVEAEGGLIHSRDSKKTGRPAGVAAARNAETRLI
jgi:hypothetical protein